jgi:hypothetical protein
MYQEETITDTEVLNPQDGQRFVDVHRTWHLGAFKRHRVQEGWYYQSKNVNCMTPGEIKPGPKCLAITILDVTGALDQYGVGGFYYDAANNEVLALVRYEGSGANNVPNRIRSYWLTAACATDGAATTNDTDVFAADLGDLTGTTSGFKNKIKPYEFTNPAGTRELIIPGGTKFRPLTRAALGTSVALPAHSLVGGLGRLYKISLGASGIIGLSNCDDTADYTNTANWTTPVNFPSFDGLIAGTPSTVNLATIQGYPVIGTKNGIWMLGQGGIPFNLTPSLKQLGAAINTCTALLEAAGGVIGNIAGAGMFFFAALGGGGNWIGPGSDAALNVPIARVMDMQISPVGDIWVYLAMNDPQSGNDTGVVWVGKKQPNEIRYNWHELIVTNFTQHGGITSDFDTAMLGVHFAPSGSVPITRLFLGGGFGANGVTNVTVATTYDASVFFGYDRALSAADANNYLVTTQYEDQSVAASSEVSWRSGCYSRHDERVKRLWTRVRFLSRSIGQGGSTGGYIVAYTGIDGVEPATFIGTLTTNDVAFSVNQVSREIELELVWAFSGAGNPDAFPATITEIHYEGREIPPRVRRITMFVEGATPTQAGGVRQKSDAKSLRDILDGMLDDISATFVDPYGNSRTVWVLNPIVLQGVDAENYGVPEGTIQLAVMEAV